MFILFVVVVISVTAAYISSEHTFYSWDYVTYQYKTLSKAVEFGTDPIRALFKTWISTSANYSDLPTLLLVPFLLAFGDSRLVYIVSIALVYLLPLALVLGNIAAKLVPSDAHRVYWFTALLTLLTPAAWIPTLRGYPDTGAALLIALAILVYLQDWQLKRRSQIVLIGFLIVVAALFRRHFVYGGIAFFIAIALQVLLNYFTQTQQRSREAWRNLVQNSVRLCWLIVISLINLATLGLPFLVKVLVINFSQLYTSFEVSHSETLQYYGTAYGWISWLLAGIGFIAGIKTRILSPVATFIALFGSVSLLQWVLKVKLLGEQYTLHFTIWIVLGLVAFCWTAWLTLKGRIRILVLGLSSLYLVLNAMIGLGNIAPNNTSLRFIVNTGISELFAENHPPLNRADYDQVAQLTAYLRALPTINQESSIYIAAATSLNESLVKNAELSLFKEPKLNLLRTPRFDSRDFYPLEPLLQAQYVVIANPYQVKNAQEQKVLTFVVDAFNQNWEIAQDFNQLPVQFTLADDVIVSVYQRIRLTSLATATRTLKAMQTYVGRRPGSQSNWVSLSEVPGHEITQQKINRSIHFLQTNKPEIPTTSFLYIGEQTPQQVKLTGRLTYTKNSCSSVVLNLNTVDTNGEIINNTKLIHYPTSTSNFMLPLKTYNAPYLLFNIAVTNSKEDTGGRCLVKIEPLSIEN